MSKMGQYMLELEEIVDPMVYTGHSDDTIKREVKKFMPDTPDLWIQDAIHRARFDYNEFDSYSQMY